MGVYIKDGKKREGIWEMGKRIEWVKNNNQKMGQTADG